MKDLLLAGLDDAVKQHVANLYNVYMTQRSNEALNRFESGIENSIAAYSALRKVICDQCDG
jgi:hypothetical protein